MDDLDFAIIRQIAHPQTFQWDVRLSYAGMARALGADEETVRARVKRLEASGILRGWDVAVNPSLFGRAFVRYATPRVEPDRYAKVREALGAIEGARMRFEMYGEHFALVAYQEPGAPAQRQGLLIEAIVGAPPEMVLAPTPPATVELEVRDWAIVEALRRDARRPYDAIADELGQSERTLRRRMDRMMEGHAVILDPDLDFERMEGAIPCAVHVVVEDPAQRGPVERELHALPRLIFKSSVDRHARASFWARTISEVEAVRRRLEAMEGVQSARADIQVRRTLLGAWLDHEVAKRAHPVP